MPSRQSLLQTRLDPATAARVRLHAERSGQSISEWIAHALRREVLRAGTGDALAPPHLEATLAVGYMVRALMLDALGADATARAIEHAAEAAAGDAAAVVSRAGDFPS